MWWFHHWCVAGHHRFRLQGIHSNCCVSRINLVTRSWTCHSHRFGDLVAHRKNCAFFIIIIKVCFFSQTHVYSAFSFCPRITSSFIKFVNISPWSLINSYHRLIDPGKAIVVILAAGILSSYRVTPKSTSSCYGYITLSSTTIPVPPLHPVPQIPYPASNCARRNSRMPMRAISIVACTSVDTLNVDVLPKWVISYSRCRSKCSSRWMVNEEAPWTAYGESVLWYIWLICTYIN